VVFLIIGAISAGAFVAMSVASMPAFDPDKLAPVESSVVLDAQDKLFTTLHAEEDRTVVSIEDIPDTVKNALVAMEDKRFYDHPGIDILGMVRAVYYMALGKGLQGGSTITQQLAKMAFLTPQRTPKRKVQEAFLALQLERDFTKDEILEMYLNRMFLGHSANGVEAAAEYYFGKSVKDLDLAESALIIGLVPSPNAYSPYRNPEKAKERQRLVLESMLAEGYIDQTQFDSAVAEELVFKERPKAVDAIHPAPYFTDYVIEQVAGILESQGYSVENAYNKIYEGGLVIRTTIDPKAQQVAEETLTNVFLKEVTPKLPGGKDYVNSLNVVEPQGAVLLMDASSGAIKAMVGGRSYNPDKLNRTVETTRQPGSSMKPLVVYGPAITRFGYTAGSVIDDAPVIYPSNDPAKPWIPENYERKYFGLTTIRRAVERSQNVVAVKLLDQIGVRAGIDFAKQLGITTLVESGSIHDINLPTALGGVTNGVKMVDMVRAYGVFANKGIRAEPHTIRTIETKDGQILYQAQDQRTVVIDPAAAYMMTNILQGVIDRGTAASIRSTVGYQGPMAGKTGTTDNNRDAWFVGFTPDTVGAVWIGHDDNSTGLKDQDAKGGVMPGGVNSGTTARIFGYIMKELDAGKEPQSFSKPRNITDPIWICNKSGKLPSPLCPPGDLVQEIFVKGTEPTEVCDLHVEVQVCDVSNELPSPLCPPDHIKTVVRIQNTAPYDEVKDKDGKPRQPIDQAQRVPTTICSIHGTLTVPVDPTQPGTTTDGQTTVPGTTETPPATNP
jgi:penicillin-binding protein 1A